MSHPRRFFIPSPPRGALASLSGPAAEHLTRVLRAEAGQLVELSDNQHLYRARIDVARKSVVTFQILEQLADSPPSVTLTLLPALFKFDRFEQLFEKSTELGVSAIQPWEAARSERGLFEAATKRIARWQKIVIEASQQSRRTRLPEVLPVVRFVKSHFFTGGSAFPNPRVFTAALLLDEDAAAPPLLSVLPAMRTPADHVAVLLGPEGGWTVEERADAVAAGWQPCSLGGTVLRAETAAIAALAVLQAAWLLPSPQP